MVYVEWDDAASRGHWMGEADLADYSRGNFLVRQCGYLLEDTRRHLLLAGSWTPEDDWHEERFGDIVRIPRTWVRVKRVLLTIGEDGSLHMRGHLRGKRT